MKAFANWILARRMNALLSTSGFTILGMAMPPVIVVGFASLALVALRRGWKEGLATALGSSLFLLVLALFNQQGVWVDLVAIPLLWLLTVVVAEIYRQFAATAWMVNGAGLLGIVLVLGAYLVLGDPAVHWMTLLNEHLRPLLVKAQVAQNEAGLDALIAAMSQVMTGGIAAFISVLMIVSTLLARWWQAMLFNPGGFRKEFYELRLGRVMAWVMLLLIAASLIGEFSLTTNLVTVVWLLFFFQGMAVIHGLIAQIGMSSAWLVSIYMLLVLMPYYAAPVISGLGFMDTWFDFRGRLQRKRQTSTAAKPKEDEDDPRQD